MLKTFTNNRCIFAIMNEMAEEFKALNLTRPAENLMPHPKAIESITKHIRNNNNRYAEAFGLMSLREQISNDFEKIHKNTYNPETEITITNGASDALFIAINAFVNDGDEVIIFEPAQDHYAPMVKMRGGIPVLIDMILPDFSYDWAKVQKAINPNTKLIIVNTPNNPTGAILSDLDMIKLQKAVNGTNIIILSDESYKNLIYDKFDRSSLASLPILKERSIIINSFSKILNIGGWRLGYVTAPEKLTKQFRQIYQYAACSVNLPGQMALMEVMQERNFFEDLIENANMKRVKFQEMLSGSRFEFKPSQSTYFQVINYEKISPDDDVSFTMNLVKNCKLATIPVSTFYKMKTDNKYIRLCYAQPYDVLEKAAEILNAQ